MKNFGLLVAVLLVSVASAYAQQSPSGLVVYDNFKSSFLDASRWSLSYNWCGSRVLECVRDIENNKLRLEVRSFGQIDSNSGNQYGNSELHFVDPAPIRSVAAQLIVRHTAVSACPANTDTQGAQSLLQGTFFNSGSGDPYDDVQAFLDIEHSAGDPVDQLNVTGFLHWQGQFFGGIGLGRLQAGQKVKAQLTWDQPNQQFVLSWTELDSGKISEGVMPYSMSDGTQAAVPDKLIAVRTFAPNCVGSSLPSAFVETRIDTVWIGK